MKEADCYPGLKVGRLTLIHKVRIKSPNARYSRGGWYCKCECGNTVTVRTDGLGTTVSCGCWNRENNYASATNKLHQKYSSSDSQPGSKYHKLYHTWCHIKDRCYNPKSKSYPNYGGRGIKMSSEWRNNYQAFKNWSITHGFHLTKNALDMTIDRIDVNGNYEPSNCRWVDMFTQANNKRNNDIIMFEGKPYTVAQLARKYHLNRVTVYNRYANYGWTDWRLVSKPYETKLKRYN